MDEKQRNVGELETTYDEENVSNGNLVTTNINELMPETTLDEKINQLEQEAERYKLEQSLEDCRKEIEGYKKQVVILSGELEACKVRSLRLDEELSRYKNSLSAADEDLRKLLNERAELKKTISEMEQNILDINHILNKIKTQLLVAPEFLNGLKKSVANWLVDSAITRTEGWLERLKNILEKRK